MTTLVPTKRPIKQGLFGFVLTFIFMLGLLLAQFIWKYSEDIFGKNFDSFIIIKFILLALLSLVTLSLPISVLVMTTIYYRQFFRLEEKKINIKGGLLFSTIISTIFFLWIAYISPINNLHMAGLLFDMRNTRPYETMERTDLNIFKGSTFTSNYSQLGLTIDSLKTAKPYTSNIDNEQFRLSSVEKIHKIQIERAKMVGFPILTFILFYSGMFLGILNRHNKLAVLLVSIYFMVLPGIYYLSIYFEKLSKQATLTAFQGQFLYLSTLTVLTMGLFLYAKRQVR